MEYVLKADPDLINEFGLHDHMDEDMGLPSISPIDGRALGTVCSHTTLDTLTAIDRASNSFKFWQYTPAPKRGELIRLLGNELRRSKDKLGRLVTLECGKILEEGKGEVQEMIDICDFAVGLSRQLHGLTIASERPNHTMQENYLPLGVVGVISAFNFPVAVWAWNFALAIVCGDSVVWKPSEKTPLTALACDHLFRRACNKYYEKNKELCKEELYSLNEVVIGDSYQGKLIVDSKQVALISATGSCFMGKSVGVSVAQRMGKSLLELGGNNAVIITPSADLDLALPSVVFGAVGTTGQRCTSTRRLFVHESIYDDVIEKLKNAYASLTDKIGNPLNEGILIGPLIDRAAYGIMENVLYNAHNGGYIVHGGERLYSFDPHTNAFYVTPALVEAKEQDYPMTKETFAPILYVMPYDTLDEAMRLHNDVPQGLSSAIFTTDIREAEEFKRQSDCGIANINIGTSGAEIGGAFGGEKETGGGRESGSDSWKQYMRRQTSTTYFGTEKPALAQGIQFDI